MSLSAAVHIEFIQEQIEKPQVVAVQPRRRPGRKPARDKSPPKQLSRPTSVDPRVRTSHAAL